MKKYAMMLAAAALIAAAPVYYAMTAQAEEAAETAPQQVTEVSIDCTKATLDAEAVPAECVEIMTKQVEPAAGEPAAEPKTE